jgi:hypothetical protein
VKVRLHAEAVEDLLSAGDWYESQRFGLGRDLLDEVDRALALIEENQTAWPRLSSGIHGHELRGFHLARFPFVLPYLVRANEW